MKVNFCNKNSEVICMIQPLTVTKKEIVTGFQTFEAITEYENSRKAKFDHWKFSQYDLSITLT
ncbi:hypothetical protein GCM10010965_30510 [Caldalkalibacillus thermarum]|nr:hypothetical protein GCM10010965_30510 [Caldalkalibacillus thermarum]